MFAALYSVAAPVDTLVRAAQVFSPRVEVTGRLVLCDLHGVERLFGGARDVADHLRRALVDAGAVRLAVAPTHTAASLLALGRPGVSVASTPHGPLVQSATTLAWRAARRTRRWPVSLFLASRKSRLPRAPKAPNRCAAVNVAPFSAARLTLPAQPKL